MLGVPSLSVHKGYATFHILDYGICNFGILPLLFKDEKDYEKIDQGDELELIGPLSSVAAGEFTLHDITKDLLIPMTLFASEDQKKTLLAGGKLNEVRS